MQDSVACCTEGLPAVSDCSSVKQETGGVEESTVIVVEDPTVKEEIKEENVETEDPLSVQSHEGELHILNFI